MSPGGGGLPPACEIGKPPECFLTSSKKAFDKCVWSGKGPDCSEKDDGERRCCDYPHKPDGTPDKSRCDCSAVHVAGGASTEEENQRCRDCMCLAEMSGESKACKAKMICVLGFDAKSHSPNDPKGGFCAGAVGASPGSPDSWRYSSARCLCDRSTGPKDDRGVAGGLRGYNQTYCDCIAGKLTEAQERQLKECRAAAAAANCAGEKADHYAVCPKKIRESNPRQCRQYCPCDSSRVKSTEICGSHVFCDCV